MASPAKKRNTGCPIAFALDIFGDRWSLMIIRDMLFRRSETYGDFLETVEKIATNVLADRLKYLETEEIITKSRNRENRRRNIYKLTEKGMELAPIVLEMAMWSAKHDPITAVPDRMVERFGNDREGYLAGIRERLVRS